ncbi:hypothetical protein NA78x_006067 [Anatilimnocola sp. NA78]|uniref:hypothetical protein n=1 Tax=Anatilimnocola sp. NA78 TaxID=3415683 RepID=UPI003CE566B2
MTRRAPLIFAIVLLLLPMLYVGSYLLLVRAVKRGDAAYSFDCPEPLRTVYAPLYPVDIQLRPDAWWIHESPLPPAGAGKWESYPPLP